MAPKPDPKPTESLISVAGLIGRPVLHKGGQEVGRLVDLVFRWDTQQTYPPLASILVRVGRRTAWISGNEVREITRKYIELNTAKLDLRDFASRAGEVRLAQDVLDHQLVDVDGARVVRASDLYITASGGQAQLVGVDVGYGSLLRRLGPARWRMRPTPAAVIDWATIRSFGGGATGGRGLQLAASRGELKRLRPSELADLLEDLGRTERQELLGALDPESAADALEEMQPEQLESLLRESSPSEAAMYLANMEPDEAADALRDIDNLLREELLSHMPRTEAKQVRRVLAYEEDTAGGFMTTAIVKAAASETVAALRRRLREDPDEIEELDAIVVVDDEGKLLHDISLIDIFLAEPDQHLGELAEHMPPVTVSADAEVEKVAEMLIASRHSSVLVVDEDGKALGRILADDVVDALLPDQNNRFHFPRVL